MKANINNIDKVVRIILALAFGVLYWQGITSGILGIALLVFGGILVLTVLFSFCPIYRIFGISTCRTKTAG